MRGGGLQEGGGVHMRRGCTDDATKLRAGKVQRPASSEHLVVPPLFYTTVVLYTTYLLVHTPAST